MLHPVRYIGGIVALCTLISFGIEALFKGVTYYAVACQQIGNIGNGSTHSPGAVAEVGKESMQMFTEASWFFFILRKHCWFKGAAVWIEVQGRFIL